MQNPVIMTNAEYHATTALSKSDLDLINRSPMHFKYAKANPKEQTPAMVFGSVVHKLVLEPDSFSAEFAVAPDVDRRTKAGKEVWAKFSESTAAETIITKELYDSADIVAQAVRNHPIAAKLLQGGQAELSYFWDDNGIECKCRPDYLREDIHAVIDLKTTSDASPEAFTKSAYNFRYHVQAAWYTRGIAQCGIEVKDFIFIVVETAPPYAVCVYVADDLMLQLGEKEAKDNLKTYAECLKTGNWCGYEEKPGFHTLSLPDWVSRKYF